jgi:hypothetical protein
MEGKQFGYFRVKPPVVSKLFLNGQKTGSFTAGFLSVPGMPARTVAGRK